MSVTLLAADDSATMRRIIEMTFAAEDVRVVTAATSEAALRAIAEERPDVVLLDAALPGTDGYEIARAMRNNTAVASIPVILLTSQLVKYDPERGRECGVSDHVVKPFDSQALIDRVQQAIARPMSQPAPRPIAQPAPMRGGAVPTAGANAASGSNRPYAQTMAFTGTPAQGVAPEKPFSIEQGFALPSAGAGRTGGGDKPILELAEDLPFESSPTHARQGFSPASTAYGGDAAATWKKPESAPPAPTVQARPSPPGAAVAVQAKVAASVGNQAEKLAGLGLNAQQIDAISALSREVIERVVWEVVPDLAETIIREEIRRITRD